MADYKFKKGDILKPVENKKSSNYISLKDIKKVEIVEYGWSSTKNLIRVKMIEGTAYDSSHYTSYYKGNVFYIYEDAFELLIPEEEDYEIY